MPDYSLGKVYKIICHKTGLVYIGSTCEPTLARRLAKHRRSYKLYLKDKQNYITSFKVLENEVYEIVLMENCSCNNKDELHKMERFLIENNVCVNKYIPGRSHKERYKDDKEQGNDGYRKDYYKNNIDKVKAYYEQNKEKIFNTKKTYREKKKQEKIENEIIPVILE